jgi:hypothetical protein
VNDAVIVFWRTMIGLVQVGFVLGGVVLDLNVDSVKLLFFGMIYQ